MRCKASVGWKCYSTLLENGNKGNHFPCSPRADSPWLRMIVQTNISNWAAWHKGLFFVFFFCQLGKWKGKGRNGHVEGNAREL